MSFNPDLNNQATELIYEKIIPHPPIFFNNENVTSALEHTHLFLYTYFCPGTMTTHAESINSDLQRGLDRHLRHTQH